VSCDVCCRFPDRDSFLRPYFTPEEIQRAVARGVDAGHFADPRGCQIAVVPNPSGEGYVCPAFDLATSRCRIYEDRPLDCQLYPLAVMWAPSRTPSHQGGGEVGEMEVVLGWDTTCPYLRGGSRSEVVGATGDIPATGASRLAPEIVSHADKIAKLLERDEIIALLANHPRLIGRFQDDVVVLRPLPKLTARLRAPFGARSSPWPDSLQPPSSAIELRPLTLADRDRFDRVMLSVDTPLAHYAVAPHLIWRHLFTYSWAEIAGCLCLFAEYADGIYMPLPPLPAGAGTRPEASPSPGALAACFAIMRDRNGGSAVSRAENVPEEWVGALKALGYRIEPKDPDYLYRSEDLAVLAGDRYKSQRAACNRFEREHRFSMEPYRDADREACLALFSDWSAQKRAAGLEETGRQLLADSEAAHREALTAHRELGLVGRVLRVDGAVRAYTFGYARSPSVFCVLLEVADRSVPGLAAVIFREVCREAAARGYTFVNTMDDSGLPSLAHAKRTYHPVRLVPSYVVTAS
jgi:hypothetical protein